MNPLILADDDGIRPAGLPDACFYCGGKVGDPHDSECVTLKRKIKVRYIFELEIEVPHHWTKDDVLFHRNDSSWCANNALDELDPHEVEVSPGLFTGCLCSGFTCEVIEIPEAAPLRHNKAGEVVP